jgi:type 1 fimbriae regulatory protein FimB/type 1 fimbriae regulatory protein FimE
LSERGDPFTTAGFARMIERAGEAAKFGFKAHPHTRATTPAPCRQASLGDKNIQHTVRYTELSPDRFKDFWR